MDRITKKLVKYYIFIISIVIFICFLGSSIFLSKYYINEQYKILKSTSTDIYNSLKENNSYDNTNIKAALITDKGIVPIGKGKMMIMSFLQDINYKDLSEKGRYKNPSGEEFFFYNMKTDLGNIVIVENAGSVSDYLKIVYLILLLVFLISLIISIPLISYVGRKFTRPILELQKSSLDIAKGNFETTIHLNTNDEIEDLSLSLETMALELKRKYDLQKDFIANVSHDFKTPLSIIRSYSEALKDGLVKNNIEEYSNEIINEVDRLNLLVMDLLELSKIQGGKIKLNKSYFNLKDFLENCNQKFRNIANEKNININITCPSVEIYADIASLSRVMYNFIDNAIKFSKPNINSEINIYTTFKNGSIIVSIKDDGIGIDENKLKDIWNRYYKHSESGGIGLGLAICSEILNLHGFNYGVNSRFNHGTEFYFIIPKDGVK